MEGQTKKLILVLLAASFIVGGIFLTFALPNRSEHATERSLGLSSTTGIPSANEDTIPAPPDLAVPDLAPTAKPPVAGAQDDLPGLDPEDAKDLMEARKAMEEMRKEMQSIVLPSLLDEDAEIPHPQNQARPDQDE